MVEAVEWLWPDYMDAEGNLKLMVQMYIIEMPSGKRIAVDTCIGNEKNLGEERFPKVHLKVDPFLERLHDAGCPPESIDTVLCTHLHFDHVGFNTVKADGAWVPLFPKARYLVAKAEWESFQEELARGRASFQDSASIFDESLRPVVDAGQLELLEAPCALAEEPGARVSAAPTPGHTPGHVSVVVESQGLSAVITGDCLHHPAQLAHPELGTYYDACSAEAGETRRALLEDAAERRVLLVGSHFPAPSAGYVRETARGAGRYELLPLARGARPEPLRGGPRGAGRGRAPEAPASPGGAGAGAGSGGP